MSTRDWTTTSSWGEWLLKGKILVLDNNKNNYKNRRRKFTRAKMELLKFVEQNNLEEFKNNLDMDSIEEAYTISN